MKSIFLDANVLIDYLSTKAIEYDAVCATAIVNYCLKRSIILFVSTHSLMILSYFLSKEMKSVIVQRTIMRKASDLFDIVTVEKSDLEAAMQSRMNDFEDAVQLSCALKAKSDILITRNVDDFIILAFPLFHPANFSILYNSISLPIFAAQ